MNLMHSCIDGSRRAMLYRLDMLLPADEDRIRHATSRSIIKNAKDTDKELGSPAAEAFDFPKCIPRNAVPQNQCRQKNMQNRHLVSTAKDPRAPATAAPRTAPSTVSSSNTRFRPSFSACLI